MRAAQTGDQRAYAELLAGITPWLRRYIRNQRPFLQAADVEDLVQDVLLSLHAVRRTYDPARPFFPWLLAIVHHRLADAARRYASRSAREAAAPEGHDEANSARAVTSSDDTPNMEESAVGDPQALHQAIRALPAVQRAAIDLLKLKEMSLKDAARELGTSVGALKVAAHRGMASLRRALARGAVKE
jgi:RNA polymerase sigma-70 factor (ECF subfamily)